MSEKIATPPQLRVAFYFNPPKAWDWSGFLAGQVGLSGTDSQVLKTAHHLSQRDGIEVLLLQSQPATAHPRIRCSQVSTPADVLAAVRAARADVLVFNNRANDATRALLAACRRDSQRCIVWDQNGPDDSMANLIADSPTVARLLCVSALQCDMVRHHRVFDKVELVYNSIDPLFFRPGTQSRNPHRVASIGCVTHTKGFHLLAEAWPAVRAAVPSATLSVLGDARLHDDAAELGPLGVAEADYETRFIVPHLGRTRADCANLGVDFRGLVSPAEIRDQLQVASIGVVNPHTKSSYETFCVSAAETQACGAAVIGGRAGGLFETVVDGRSGLLVSSTRELSRALVTLLKDPARTAAMGEYGRHFIAGAYGPGRNTDRWTQLLLDVVAGRPPETRPLRMKNLNRSILLRETLRQARAVPLIGSHTPTLDSLRRVRSYLRNQS